MEKKGYKISLSKTYSVEFVKNGVRHKKGDTANVNIATATALYKKGLINPSKNKELMEDIEKCGMEKEFGMKPKEQPKTDL